MIYHFNPEEKLTLDKIQEIIDKKMTLALSDEAKRRIEKCRNYLNQKMETQKVPIYGVTSATSASARSSSASCRKTS